MERLLSEQEITDAMENIPKGSFSQFFIDCYQAVAKAQLAKTDKEWVEWIDKNLDDISPDCCEKPTKPKCKDCSCAWKVWQSRCKEIGL
jgi:hypothetical protein